MPEILMSDMPTLLGKALVAIFLSLLLNYIYIALVSRLKKPSDKEVLESLQITWQGEGGWTEEMYERYGSPYVSPDSLQTLYKPKQSKEKKRGKSGGNRKPSRGERKRHKRKTKG